MEKIIDTLEDLYGIKDRDSYIIFFKSEKYEGSMIEVKGEILNFHPTQVVLKGEKGLYIISPKNIIEMRPIFTVK